MNKVILLGRLGKDPEVRHTASGVAVTSFTLATSEKWRDKAGQTQEMTQWTNIVCWNKLAETVGKYAHKGKQVLVEGKLTHRDYEDKTGAKRYITEVIADNVRFVGGTPNDSADQGDSEL